MVPGQATNGAWYLNHVLLRESAFPSKLVLLAGVLNNSKQTIGIVIIITTGYGAAEAPRGCKKMRTLCRYIKKQYTSFSPFLNGTQFAILGNSYSGVHEEPHRSLHRNDTGWSYICLRYGKG